MNSIESAPVINGVKFWAVFSEDDCLYELHYVATNYKSKPDRFTSELFATPEAAIACGKKVTDRWENDSKANYVRSVFQSIGVPGVRAELLANRYRGLNTSRKERAQIPDVWHEAALKSGMVYRGHCIIVFRCKSGWRYAHGGSSNDLYCESKEIYIDRSKALLEARKEILESAAEMAINRVFPRRGQGK